MKKLYKSFSKKTKKELLKLIKEDVSINLLKKDIIKVLKIETRSDIKQNAAIFSMKKNCKDRLKEIEMFPKVGKMLKNSKGIILGSIKTIESIHNNTRKRVLLNNSKSYLISNINYPINKKSLL